MSLSQTNIHNHHPTIINLYDHTSHTYNAMKSTISKAVSSAFPIFCAFVSVYGQNSGLKPLVNKGCYSSAGGMTDQGSYTYQTPGWCQQQCVNLDKPVMGTTQGSNCYCGDLLPSSDDQVSNSQCSSPCNGYAQDMCKFWFQYS